MVRAQATVVAATGACALHARPGGRSGAATMTGVARVPDGDLVSEAAAALDIPEIAIFRRAWTHWYGGTPDERRIEPPFLRYMFGGSAPPWVRAYARHVVESHRREPIDPRAWGVRSSYVRNPVRGYLLTLASVTVIVVLVVLADSAARHIAGTDACYTPPCYGDGRSPGQE